MNSKVLIYLLGIFFCILPEKLQTEHKENQLSYNQWQVVYYFNCVLSVIYYFVLGHLGATVVKRLPSAQGVIRRYGVEPHIRLLRYEPASSSPTHPAVFPFPLAVSISVK